MNEELRVLIERAATALKAHGAKEVYIFGSVATGKMDDYSDIDLAVSGLPDEVFFKAMGEAREILQRVVDLIDLDDDNPFTRYLKEENELVRVA